MDKLVANLQRMLLEDSLTTEHFTALFDLIKTLDNTAPVSESAVQLLYDLLSSIFTLDHYNYLLYALKLIAIVSHVSNLATMLLDFVPPAFTLGGDDSTLDTESNRLYFQIYDFAAEVEPPDRLVYLILSLLTIEIYDFNPVLFNAALLALEGLTFYVRGKKRALLNGGLDVLPDVIKDLSLRCNMFDFSAPAANDSRGSVAVTLLETLTNILTYKMCRIVYVYDGSQKLIERVADNLGDILMRALVTAQSTEQSNALIACIMACVIESDRFYNTLRVSKPAIEKILNICISGSSAGSRCAILLAQLLLLGYDKSLELGANTPSGSDSAPMQRMLSAGLSDSLKANADRAMLLLSQLARQQESVERDILVHDTQISDRAFYDSYYERLDAINEEISQIRDTYRGLVQDVIYAGVQSCKQSGKTPGSSAARSGATARLGYASTGRGIGIKRPGNRFELDMD